MDNFVAEATRLYTVELGPPTLIFAVAKSVRLAPVTFILNDSEKFGVGRPK